MWLGPYIYLMSIRVRLFSSAEAELEAEWTRQVSSGTADLAEERRLLDCAAKLEFHNARMLHVAFGSRGFGMNHELYDIIVGFHGSELRSQIPVRRLIQ